MLTDVLKGTFTAAYGTGQGLGLDNDMPAAGKTGTTNSSKDTWFCGYTRYYTTAIWVAMIYQEICLVSMVPPMQEGSGNPLWIRS